MGFPCLGSAFSSSNSYPDSEQLRSGTQATPGLTCIRVRSDSTYDCSVSSRVMVTCFRISWGDRRQRVSSALFLSHAPPAVTGAQPSPRSSRSVLPKAPWTSTLQVCARVLPLQTIPLPATPSLPPQTALLNSHPSAPLSRAIGSSGDLLFTSWLPIGLLKRLSWGTVRVSSFLVGGGCCAGRVPSHPVVNPAFRGGHLVGGRLPRWR